MTNRPSWRLIDRLRHASHSGRVISRHRALRTLDFRPASILHPIVLMLLSYVGLTLGLQTIAEFWEFILIHTLPPLVHTTGIFQHETTVLGVIPAAVPYPAVSASVPSTQNLLIAAVASLSLMACAYIFLRGRTLPLGYLVWAICLLQLVACSVFYFFGSRFPHTLASHVADGFSYTLNLLFICPLVLAVTYFIFDIPLLQKILGTACVLLSLILVTPFQYLIHIGVIHHTSLVAMPALYIFFGLLFNIAVLIAIFGWCISWKQ